MHCTRDLKTTRAEIQAQKLQLRRAPLGFTHLADGDQIHANVLAQNRMHRDTLDLRSEVWKRLGREASGMSGGGT